VSKSKILLSLPCVRIEVLNQTRQEMSLVGGESVCQLVLDWVKRQCDDTINMDQLTEKVSLANRKFSLTCTRRLINVSVIIIYTTCANILTVHFTHLNVWASVVIMYCICRFLLRKLVKNVLWFS
jgi:hypothetical protein